ncbi:MAG: hypothetical protein ACYCZR_07485 [Burkholderiales bacterium]
MDEVTGTPELEPANAVTQGAETDNDDEILSVIEDESPAGDEAPKDEEPKPRKLKVKIDGQELEVDEDEAARGYQRQADYSRHMQALQAERQQAEQIKARYQQQLEQFIPESVARYQALQQAAEQYRQEGNFEALAAVQYDMQAEGARYQQANAERQRIQEESQAQTAAQRQQALKQAETTVIEAIPEWKNPAVRSAEVKEVATVLSEFVGKHYGDQAPRIMADINDGLYGAMPVVLARKALLYDKLMAKVASRKAGQSEMTNAPAPATTVRTSGGASKDPGKMSTEEWMAWRNKQARGK